MKTSSKTLIVICSFLFFITSVCNSADIVNIVRNSSFEDGTVEWQLLITAPAAAKWEVEKNGVAGKCVHMSITAVSGTSWHVEIHQGNQVLKAGQEYTFNFWVKTEEGVTRVIQPGIEGLGASDWWQDINITGKWSEFTKTWIQGLSGSATIHFALAQVKGEVWLDHVRLYEGKYKEEDLEKFNEKGKAVKSKGKLVTTWASIRYL